jgi:two-component system, chemotaxis family, chemotaxis protein CheY
VNILIVEDEATSREILLNILKAEGDHRILTASDGDTALKLMEDPKHPFDVVFLDLQLPAISGLDLLERVRATPACRYVRVIVCTTSTDSATVVRAARLGVRHYMVKPPDKIRVTEQLNIIKAEIAGLQKIERPEETASRLGIDIPAYKARVGSTLESMEKWLTQAKANTQSSDRKQLAADTGRLKSEALDLGLREVGRRFSTLETRLSIEPTGDMPDSRAIEIAFIMSHLHGELNRVRSVLKIIVPDRVGT